MNDPSPPNVLFIVLDSCRLDYAKKHASNLNSLRDSGVWFENAITSGVASLASHASLFTGLYPHDHKVTKLSDDRIPTPLVSNLSERGYQCYGVSANGFAGYNWYFDDSFDQFRYTQGPELFIEGADMYGELRKLVDRDGLDKPTALLKALKTAIANESTGRSLANLFAVMINHLSREELLLLQNIPHELFGGEPRYLYSPWKNTNSIRRILASESDQNQPFFIFTNYMDPHRPFLPPDQLQQKHVGKTFDRDELIRLNEEKNRTTKLIQEKVSEEELKNLRSLYAAEVESVDRHFGYLFDALEQHDHLDDTIVIVTADHGEALGEVDSLGRREIGHSLSISEHISKVPLLISHPRLPGEMVTENVPLKNIYHFIMSIANGHSPSIEPIFSEQPVICEHPARGSREKFRQKHPDAPEEYVFQYAEEDLVSAHERDWRVVGSSDGTRIAEKDGKSVPISEAPPKLVNSVDDSLEELSQLKDTTISKSMASHLEELGYL